MKITEAETTSATKGDLIAKSHLFQTPDLCTIGWRFTFNRYVTKNTYLIIIIIGKETSTRSLFCSVVWCYTYLRAYFGQFNFWLVHCTHF